MNTIEASEVITTRAVPSALDRDVLTEKMKHRVPRLTPAEIIAWSLSPDEINIVARIADEFGSKVFQEHIDQGTITVAMVRPQANDSALGGTDSTASHEVIKEIKKHQRVILKFSCILNRQMCEVFYAGRPREIQESMASIRTPHITRWEEFVRQMTSGPTTVLILHSQAGDAIPRWRKHIGVLRNSESGPTTIRGKFGSPDDYNNVVHGSDSIESVHREIQFFRGYLSDIVTCANTRHYLR
jgi:nucleoside diphosphate kinase